ncbi:FAD-dependent monooxygenase [Actinomycetospora termitidis]|uniref:FAD-dependent monooxygenase n=1 Tax=Actinomycetospora termitidis TaxID=3053470 RepID=A0ABT7MDV7_9PSEU|nr:FAD-dependent monooxygenase [Actinomycetospora sp. Odt1-22]MDL5158057.1 FAD-dependent monooxygenase [Actinomycetospora sp. Odt1-22]
MRFASARGGDAVRVGRAVVVGGGIGGLAAACGLVRAGWDVEVRERLEHAAGPGGISLWPNALRALDVLGLGDAVRHEGLVQAAGGIRDRRGRWIVRTDQARMIERHGDGVTVLPRARLLAILRERLPPGVVHTGAPVERPEEIDADLVVGADGIGSTVRRLVAPGARPGSTGTVAWRLVAHVDDPPTEGGETWADGCYAGIAPLRDGRVNLWAVVRDDEPAARDPAALRRRFADVHAPIPELLAAADPDSAHVTGLSWLPPLRTFRSGRTVLLGDAAHAMTPNLGQGGCLALEDAAVLARCSHDLDRYDRLRRPRTAALTRRSRLAGLVAGLSGPFPTAGRDGLGRLLPAALTLRALDGVLGWQPPCTVPPTAQ